LTTPTSDIKDGVRRYVEAEEVGEPDQCQRGVSASSWNWASDFLAETKTAYLFPHIDEVKPDSKLETESGLGLESFGIDVLDEVEESKEVQEGQETKDAKEDEKRKAIPQLEIR
jgi:hypothetical protein